MRREKPVDCDGKTWYRQQYAEHLSYEADWFVATAKDKVDSIQQLLVRNSIAARTLAEFGCGTGAVILGCRERGIGNSFFGVDYSSDAIRHFHEGAPDVWVEVADITDRRFRFSQPVDVLLLSHVLEHLEGPLEFLQACIEKVEFRYLIAEVPLEALPLLSLKAALFGRNVSAGHVQYYTANGFRELIAKANLGIVDERIYSPVYTLDALRLLDASEGWSRSEKTLRYLFRRYLPRFLSPLWRRYYCSNHAVLCAKL